MKEVTFKKIGSMYHLRVIEGGEVITDIPMIQKDANNIDLALGLSNK